MHSTAIGGGKRHLFNDNALPRVAHLRQERGIILWK